MRRLLSLRLALAELCVAMLEEHCAKKMRQALARQTKTSAEIALEEFTRCTPEPNSTEQVSRRTNTYNLFKNMQTQLGIVMFYCNNSN